MSPRGGSVRRGFARGVVLALAGACASAVRAPVREVRASPEAPLESWDVLDSEAIRRVLQHSPLPPPPPDPTNAWSDREDAARLGQALFYDPRMSADGTISCSTCHDPRHSFADGKRLAEGMRIGRRHTPTLWNVAYNRWFFWDGRADTLWTQALFPLENDLEHGFDRGSIAALIRSDPGLARAYEAVFGEPARDGTAEEVDRVFTRVGKAIAAYERHLLSRSSRFDRFVAGLRRRDPESIGILSASERRGLALFVGKANCRLCHAGPLFTDREFHDTRVPVPRGRASDPGRYGGIEALLESEFRSGGRFGDQPEEYRPLEPVRRGETWGEFKTPSLRNVALTAPYMHQGQLATLRDVVSFYSTLENARPPHDHGETTMVPLELEDREIDDLVAFLGALSDDAIDPVWVGPPSRPLPGTDERD